MTGPTTAPNRPDSSVAMRDRKRSALSLLLSTKPRRLLARSPSRGAGGMGGDSSATVGSSTDRMFSAPKSLLDMIGSNLIQRRSARKEPLAERWAGAAWLASPSRAPERLLVGPRRQRQHRAGLVATALEAPAAALTPAGAAIGGSPCPWCSSASPR